MPRDIESPTELRVRARPTGITRMNRKAALAIGSVAAVILGAVFYGVAAPPEQRSAQAGGSTHKGTAALKRDDIAVKELHSLIPDGPIRPRLPDPPPKPAAVTPPAEERPPLAANGAGQAPGTLVAGPAQPINDPYADLRKSLIDAERDRMQRLSAAERAATDASTVVGAAGAGDSAGPLGSLQRVAAGGQNLLAQAGGAGVPTLPGVGQGNAAAAMNGLMPRTESQAQQAAQAAREGLAGDVDPNKQLRKEQFLREPGDPNYVRATRVAPVSPFEVKAGWVIPAVMEHGITSDLPGRLTARVTQNVYDSATGAHLLIPQGTRLVGIYDSQVAWGQSRMLVAWNRLIFPDGSSFDIARMGGVDESGYAGFKDQVNNHYGRLFGFAVMTSLFSAAFQLSQPRNAVNPATNTAVLTDEQIVAGSVGREISRLGVEISRKNMQIQPTIEIRPGLPFHVRVERDMLFPKAYADGNVN